MLAVSGRWPDHHHVRGAAGGAIMTTDKGCPVHDGLILSGIAQCLRAYFTSMNAIIRSASSLDATKYRPAAIFSFSP